MPLLTYVNLIAALLASRMAFDAYGSTDLFALGLFALSLVLAYLLGIPHERIWRLATAPASLTCIDIWADGGASVAFVNDMSHLR